MLHQNDGFAWGPDRKLYFGVGSTTDRGRDLWVADFFGQTVYRIWYASPACSSSGGGDDLSRCKPHKQSGWS